MKLALKVDVATSRGIRKGVPRLMEALARHRARATFFLNVGREHAFGQTWLPGWEIGRRCMMELRAVRDAGFELGVLAFDHARWRRAARGADAVWTRRQIEISRTRFEEIFGEPALVHGAADWQTNRHAYRLSQRLGLRYASDTRGTRPYLPVHNAEIIACPQVPTTLPTLDEMLNMAAATAGDAVDRLLRLSADAPPHGHVYSLRAELEGIKFVSVFEKLLAGWRRQGYALVPLAEHVSDVNLNRLPRHCVTEGRVPGRNRMLALQGKEFLAG
jgi:undecaprenyl phosphate-alpha-L-ara4FN deformylase